jgi:hypothetical protein
MEWSNGVYNRDAQTEFLTPPICGVCGLLSFLRCWEPIRFTVPPGRGLSAPTQALRAWLLSACPSRTKAILRSKRRTMNLALMGFQPLGTGPNPYLVQLVHHRRLADSRITRHEHQFRNAVGHDPFEGSEQRLKSRGLGRCGSVYPIPSGIAFDRGQRHRRSACRPTFVCVLDCRLLFAQAIKG